MSREITTSREATTAAAAVATGVPSTNAQPNAPSGTDGNLDTRGARMNIDVQKAKEVLVHRKMLLKRMQLCRQATQARLQLYEKGGNEISSETVILSRKRKFVSKEAEIESYADLSKYALSFTVKKVPPIKAPPPAPRNISLRTGSTVGNKMKAAVATLTTNVGWVSDNSSQSNAKVNKNISVPPTAPAIEGISQPAQPSMKNGSDAVAVAPLHKAIPPPAVLKSAAISAVPITPATSTMSAPKNNVKKLSATATSTGKQLKKKSSQQGKKRSGKSIRGGNNMSSSEIPASKKPLHLAGSKGVGQNGREFNYPSRVLCPETDRLRRKRREIVAKLDKLARKRYGDILIKQDIDRQKLKRIQFIDNPYSKGMKMPWKNLTGAGTAPCILPEKRKTQWDYVLEEMRWLATDFVEEHKWKKASAKTLATAVTTYHVEASTQAKLSPPKQDKVSPSSSKVEEKVSNGNLIEVKMEREDESMDEDSESDSAVDELMSSLEFVDPTDEDVKSAVMNAKLMNKYVEAHWKLAGLNPEMVHGDEQAAAYSRQGRIRQREAKTSETANVQEAPRDKNEEWNSNSQVQNLSFEEIQKQIQSSLESIKSAKSEMVDKFCDYYSELSDGLDSTDLEVQEEQAEKLQFAETLWKEEKNRPVISGSIITGPIGCGKTFTTGLLLWRRRHQGPQLLLCTGASLIRWRHELRNFPDLNILTFGAGGWYVGNVPIDSRLEWKPNDIILSDFSGARSLSSKGKRRLPPFATVIVDARATSFPSANHIDESNNNWRQRNKNNYASQEIQSSYGRMIAGELYSNEWWNTIIENLLSPSTKCGVVETSGIVTGRSYSEEQKATHGSMKEKSDIISFKVAFLFHQIFQSKHKTYCRRAFWWAKKHYIALKKSKSPEVELRGGGIKGVLLNLLEAISFLPDISVDDLEHEVCSSIPRWTVQTCPLSALQRESYECACMFVRGSFQISETNAPANSYLACAKAFLRLRRACFHSDLQDVLPYSNDYNLLTLQPKRRPSSRFYNETSSSQPDISRAKSLLERSSKLRQLLLILSKDCGIDVPSKSYLLGTKPTRRGRKSSSGKRKKVLILASLPEVILLISSFLSAIGIAHERLELQGCLQASAYSEGETEASTLAQSISSWSQCQQSIGRFEFSPSDSSSTSVLVSSPHSLSSTSLGLNASNAEVIISLDEDWSGGSDLSTFSILKKNITRNMQKTTGRKYIKLIAEDTCEQSFLTFDKKGRGKRSVQAMPMMITSLLLTRLDQHGFITPFPRSIIGKNVLRFVGVPLQNVFSSDFIPLCALHGGPTLFFATNIEGYIDEKDESDLAKYGDKVPALLNDLDEEPMFVKRVGKENACLFGQSMSKMERTSSMLHRAPLKSKIDIGDPYESKAPETTRFPSIVTRRDLLSIQIQKYLSFTKAQLSQLENNCSKNLSASKKMSKPNGEKPRSKEKRSNSTSSETSSPFSQAETKKSKPEVIAASLIWYDCDSFEDFENAEIMKDEGMLQENKKRRTNSYVRSYVSIHRKFDGNQGRESLVYFPPLFPGLIESNHGNESDYNAFDQSLLNRDMNQLIPDDRKRKSSSIGSSSNSKRLRGNPPINSVPDFTTGMQNINPSQAPLTSSILSKDMANDLMAVSDVDFMDGATDLFDGDFLPDLNITKDEEVINDNGNDAERSEDMELEDTIKPSLDEDFGILGSGLLPSLEDSSKAAMRQNGNSNLYSYWLDPFEPLSWNDEAPFNGPALDSVILHVKKSTKPATGMMHRPMPTSSMQPPSLPFNKPMVGIIHSNGGLTKKKKKNGSIEKRQSLGPTTAFVSNPPKEPIKIGNPPPSVHTDLMTKDPKARIERTIFDSFGHRGGPSIRVQHQIQAMLDPSRNQMMRSGLMSPNYQNSLLSSQCSIRELLPEENTGDAAKNLSKKQLSSFCQDFLVSFGVDFGPFSVGVLQESSAKHQKISTETHIGIKLPMGVKVPKSMGSFSKTIDVWTSDEDKLLQTYVVNFGFNWHVISQALTRKSRTSACLDTMTIMNPIRSARLCKERWNLINLSAAHSSEGKLPGCSDVGKTEENHTFSSSSEEVIIDHIHLTETYKLANLNPASSGKIVNRLQKLKKASRKTQHVPLTIPGYTSGANMPPLQIVPSHPSHSNSVQEAIATSAGPSGIVPPRAEMWPLQFLDLTEKQHQEVEKKKSKSSSSNQVAQQPVMSRNTSQGARVVPNPGVPHAAPHTHRPMPPNPQRQAPPPPMPHVQQQIAQQKVIQGKRPNTKPGK